MFTHLNPRDTGNPFVTDMIGTNYAGLLASGPPYPVDFTRCQMSANARAATSATNTIVAGALTPSGTWTTDTTYPYINGKVSTTNASCLTKTLYIPNGVFFEWSKIEDTSGGTHQVSVDGTPAVDTITGSSTISSQGPYIAAVYNYVGVGRYEVSVGSHLITSCVTSATGSGNDVTIYGIAYPPQKYTGGIFGPRVNLMGVMYYQDAVSDPGLDIANMLNQQVATQLVADGLQVVFVPVRNFVDPHLGMLTSPEQNCGAAGNPGLHVNDCGTVELAQAVANTANLVTYPATGNPNIEGPLNIGAATAATSIAGFDQMPPHNYLDPLLKGTQNCSAANCGVKQFNSGGFGFGPWINCALPIGVGFLTGAGTSEADWTWPFKFYCNSGNPYLDLPGIKLGGGATLTTFNTFAPAANAFKNCSGTCSLTENISTWRILLTGNSTLDLSGITWLADGVPAAIEVCEDPTGGRTFAQGTDLWDIWPSDLLSALASAGPSACASFTFTRRNGGAYFVATSGSFLGLAPLSAIPTAGTGITNASGTFNSNAVYQIPFQPGTLTSIAGTISGFSKVSKATTVDNITGSAYLFSCIANPTVTMYECGTDASCTSPAPTPIGTVTVTAAGTAVNGTVSSAAITAGDYVGWALTAGTCTSLDISANAQVHSN